MIYRTICTQLWTDKKVRQLSVQGKCLFVYLITNPHTHLSGIYYLPVELIAKETGLSHTLSHTLLDTLSQPSMKLTDYDTETSTVFVTNMFRYQGRGEKNERAAAKHLDSLHHSRLITAFLESYPSVRQFCSDTLSHTLSEVGKSCPSVPDPDSSSVSVPNGKERESERKKGKRAISESDKPTEKHFEFAKSLGVELGAEWGKFKNYCKAHDKRYADFEAAFRNWLSNATGGKYAVPHVR